MCDKYTEIREGEDAGNGAPVAKRKHCCEMASFLISSQRSLIVGMFLHKTLSQIDLNMV